MDSILFWNDVALEANRVSHTNGKGEQTGPPLSARALAIIHLAMYDAYAAVNPTPANPPYISGLPIPPAGTSARAAVSGAAYTTLSALFPSQQTFFDSRLGFIGDPLDSGHDFGVTVAKALLHERANDPPVSDIGYKAKPGRGNHRVDPNNPNQGYHAPFYGARCAAFAVTTRPTLDPPPFEQSIAARTEYAKALREVRGHGIAPELMGTVPSGIARRTVDQTLIGLFWGYDGALGLGTPPRLYNQIIRRLAQARSPGSATVANSEVQNARLFALVNAAMADAAMLAWDDKYRYDFWRPILGLREHDVSMGPGTTTSANNIVNDTDPGWLPLGAPATNSMNQHFAMPINAVYPCNQPVPGFVKNFTPPFPAYPSGHATFGAAALHITRLFYNVTVGDRSPDTLFDGLDFVSEELNGINQDNLGTIRPNHRRRFPEGLWQMIIENGISRVYLGVHWSFDAFAKDANGDPDLLQNIGGVKLGLDIAENIFTNGLIQSQAAGPRV